MESGCVRHQLKCLRGLLPHLRTNIESGARKVKVDAADGRVLVTDYDLVGLPGQEAPAHRISIVVRRDADPIARLEADVFTLGRPILRLARLRFLRDLDCLVGRHLSYVAMPDRGCRTRALSSPSVEGPRSRVRRFVLRTR